jgi:acetyl-CoA acetyltransferase family protein
MSERVCLVFGKRTPFARAGGKLSSFSTLDLATLLIKDLISYKTLQLNNIPIDEIVLSTVLPNTKITNLTREAIIASKINEKLIGHTVTNNCISGLVAIAIITDAIKSGRIYSGIAGGIESMSNPSLALSKDAERFFLGFNSKKTVKDKFIHFLNFKPKFVFPLPPSPKEPSTGLTMGEHCELMVKEFNITRKEQDEWALLSHQKAAAAYENNLIQKNLIHLNELAQDDIIRPNTSLERLSSLPTVFDRSVNGTLTAGNSSSLTDGASGVLLVAESKAKEYQLPILGYIDDVIFSSISPEHGLLMAPVVALPQLLQRNSLEVSDIDFFEIHEAFSGQVLCNLKTWREGWNRYPDLKVLGEIPKDKINIYGGSLAIGHPFAATGGRLLLTLADILNYKNGSRGVISVCAAGAMGGVVLFSRN